MIEFIGNWLLPDRRVDLATEVVERMGAASSGRRRAIRR
jgi:hypothetical protein